MTLTKTLSDYARRPQRAAEADGLNDVLSGITFLAITGMWYANNRLTATIHGADFAASRDFQVATAVFVLAAVAMFAVILGAKRAIRTLRERFVYRRLGYVAPQGAPALRQKMIVMVLSMVSMVVLARIGMHRIQAGQPPFLVNSGILPAVLGGLGGGVYLYQFLRLGFARHLILGFVLIAAASALPLLKLDDILAIRCMTIFWGLASIIAGAVTFSRLLRTPLIGDGEDDTE